MAKNIGAPEKEAMDSEKTQASKKTSRKRSRGNKKSSVPASSQKYGSKQFTGPVSSAEPKTATSYDIVFPGDSASMKAFGNATTTPGQDNFISSWNQNWRISGSQGPLINLSFAAPTKRTSNAMCVDILPWFGSLEPNAINNWDSPLDTAALNLKQFIDTSFGTSTNYSAPALMMYMCGVYATFPVIAELKRDLRLALTYLENQYPQYVPMGLFALLQIPDGNGNYLDGEGANYTATHLRSYVDRLNLMIDTFNTLPMPPEIGAFRYNDGFFDAIFTDSEDFQTAQLYVFRNAQGWMYTEEAEGGPCLMNINLGRDIESRLAVLSQMIKRLTALRTTSVAMLTNLFNAYGSKDTIRVDRLDITNFTPVAFRYDENILTMVENMVVCAPGAVSVSYITETPDQTHLSGHIWVNENYFSMLFDVPLQFHKPSDSVTQGDIGWAMRLKPSFRIQRQITVRTPEAPTGQVVDAFTCDSFVGFAICRDVRFAHIKDDGLAQTYTLSSRQLTSSNLENYVLAGDFKARPILIAFGSTVHDNVRDIELYYYTAQRDVEVTYRLEDLTNFWTYMSVSLWGANVNRNVTGTRMK